jgi:prepilin-type N-terminal cleavage/methylation domain-containing protein
MIKRNNKKGFTIVELVIVIAVIAILAAVLIPTFSGIINKANLSSDQQAVREMNTILVAEFAIEAPASIKEVIDALDENGFNVDALTPLTKDHKFLWNVGTKTIALVSTTDNKVIYPADVELGETKDLNEDGASFINKEVNSAADLATALSSGNDVTLTNNVANAAEIIIPANADVTLDLGGFKYTAEKTNAGTISQTSKYIKVSKGSTLTIKNGTFEGRGIMNNGGKIVIEEGTTVVATDVNGGGCIRNKAGGEIVINGGTFSVPNHIAWDEVNYGGAAVIHNDGGKITVKGGTFTSATDAYLVSNVNGGTLIIDGGTFTAYRGALYTGNSNTTVNGGTFNVTNDSNGGWTVIHEGTGSTTLNGGEYSHVVESRKFFGVSGK